MMKSVGWEGIAEVLARAHKVSLASTGHVEMLYCDRVPCQRNPCHPNRKEPFTMPLYSLYSKLPAGRTCCIFVAMFVSGIVASLAPELLFPSAPEAQETVKSVEIALHDAKTAPDFRVFLKRPYCVVIFNLEVATPPVAQHGFAASAFGTPSILRDTGSLW